MNHRVWLTSSLSSDPLLLDHDRLPKAMGFDPTSRLLASATQGGGVRIWNLATGTQRGPVGVHRANVEELAFNEDGTLFWQRPVPMAQSICGLVTRAKS